MGSCPQAGTSTGLLTGDGPGRGRKAPRDAASAVEWWGQAPPNAGTGGRWKRLDVDSRLALWRDPAPPHLHTKTFLLL